MVETKQKQKQKKPNKKPNKKILKNKNNQLII